MNVDSIPRPEHPRPDLARQDWLSLNGPWEFTFDDADEGLSQGWDRGTSAFAQTIQVPFAYQAPLSGIGDPETHEIVWYRRTLRLPASFAGRRSWIRFGAVDWECDLWVNGRHVVHHEGGYTPFQADLTPYLTSSDAVLVLRVVDRDDAAQPRGKQSWRGERFGCWYTGNTGVWQSVWIEAVGAVGLTGLQIDSDLDRRQATFLLDLDGVVPDLELSAEVTFDGRPFRTLRVAVADRRPKLTLDLEGPDQLDLGYLWHPNNPKLFDVVLTLSARGRVLDRVETYFGVRKIHVHQGQIYLNFNPIDQNLVLDQGYWPDGLLTPPSDEAIRQDIALAQRFGFNGARKHQKFEDPRYYYWADRMGFLVWGEMPSAYRFHPQALAQTTAQWQEFLARDRNHPSIVAWVPLNESWGVYNILTDPAMQNYSRALYALTKAVDPTRLVSSNDGWEQVDSDLCAVHDYEASGARFAQKTQDKAAYLGTRSDHRALYASGSSHRGEPVLLTEWGGIAFSGGRQGEWGYNGTVDTEEQFLDRFRAMVQAFRGAGFFVGHCYTQLTDVQQEINGLATPDRRPKVDPARVKAILSEK